MDVFIILNIHGRKVREVEGEYFEACEMGDRLFPACESFMVKGTKGRAEVIDARDRESFPRLKAIRNINFDGAFPLRCEVGNVE